MVICALRATSARKGNNQSGGARDCWTDDTSPNMFAGRSVLRPYERNVGFAAAQNSVDFLGQSCRLSDCLLFFQPAWEYLLFDNRMIQARTRLVFGFCSGCTGTKAN